MVRQKGSIRSEGGRRGLVTELGKGIRMHYQIEGDLG